MVNNTDQSDQVSWNMAQLLNIELGRLREQANTALVAGSYRKAVDALRSMSNTAIHVMSINERKSLQDLENEFELPLMLCNGISSFNLEERKKANQAIFVIRKKFSRYNELLMDILDTHGFLGSYKEDAGKMKV